MNSNQLIDAIGAVNDAAVLDAKAFHYRGDAAAARPRFRKMTVGVAAVLAVLLCIVAVAFAVDQEFRAAVLSFFHISAEDHVERVPVEDQPLTGDDAAGKISPSQECVFPTTVTPQMGYLRSAPMRSSTNKGVTTICISRRAVSWSNSSCKAPAETFRTTERLTVYIWSGRRIKRGAVLSAMWSFPTA